MNQRDDVVAAFETNDQLSVRRLGWWPVWEAAHTWWAPRQTLTAKEFVPYAKALGEYPPDVVLKAFEGCAGDWRPTPGALMGWLRKKDGDVATNAAGKQNRSMQRETLEAVAEAFESGERPCDCPCPTAIKWRGDARCVWRCPKCNGLEQAQVYEAQNVGLIPSDDDDDDAAGELLTPEAIARALGIDADAGGLAEAS